MSRRKPTICHGLPYVASWYLAPNLGGPLAGKQNLLYCLGPGSSGLYTSRFWIIFEDSQNCKQITATPCRSTVRAEQSSQLSYTANIQEI